MRRLVDDLPVSVSIGTGHPDITPAPMDLGKLVDRLVTELQASARQHGLVVEELAVIKGWWDEERLGQLFANLLTNAINCSPPDGQIRLRGARRGDEAVVAISDEGSPSRQQEALFCRFFRAEAAQGIMGMGLGLYIAKAITDAHGARVWVDSTFGAGTTFSVTLLINDD